MIVFVHACMRVHSIVVAEIARPFNSFVIIAPITVIDVILLAILIVLLVVAFL